MMDTPIKRAGPNALPRVTGAPIYWRLCLDSPQSQTAKMPHSWTLKTQLTAFAAISPPSILI
jgi:hypothetical protein